MGTEGPAAAAPQTGGRRAGMRLLSRGGHERGRGRRRARAPWQAPRIAYLLTAAVAENDHEAGHALWPLDDHEQADVLAALAAQLRLTFKYCSDRYGPFTLPLDTSVLIVEICRMARGEFEAVLAGQPWEPPACAHCREYMAGALCSVIVNVSRTQLAMSPEVIAHNCRRTADRVAPA